MIKLHLSYPSVWGLYDGWGAKRRLSPTYTKWRVSSSKSRLTLGRNFFR
ncbi:MULTISPECIES: hypothetical protein [Ensifer]|jgi:crossover junction endodeoxyribonuclease RusA|nr:MULTISPECIES: hypothetical protein [Ensifer]SFH54434.1 hypothetical protein SAMN05216459_14614 [Ensifer sp. OV372]